MLYLWLYENMRVLHSCCFYHPAFSFHHQNKKILWFLFITSFIFQLFSIKYIYICYICILLIILQVYISAYMYIYNIRLAYRYISKAIYIISLYIFCLLQWFEGNSEKAISNFIWIIMHRIIIFFLEICIAYRNDR